VADSTLHVPRAHARAEAISESTMVSMTGFPNDLPREVDTSRVAYALGMMNMRACLVAAEVSNDAGASRRSCDRIATREPLKLD
jgi:hypothetical protein